MSRPSSVLMKAAAVPVFTVKGATASIISCCSLSQIFCRFDDNASNTDRRIGDVVVLERFQLPARRLLTAKTLLAAA